MCGIAGYFSHQLFAAPQLEAMTQRLAHRGPDGEGYWYDTEAGVGLGHRLLHIMDHTEAARQPIHSPCGRYVMVYNGEIYNYREVAQALKLEGPAHNDTQVVIAALAKEGPAAVHRFNGMFAIACYDKTERRLYLLRDPHGIKPLVYYWDGQHLAFASELKALKTLPVSLKLDLQSLQDFLFLEYIPGSRTIWQGCHKVPAGHWLTLDSQGLRLTEYFNPVTLPIGRSTDDETAVTEHWHALIATAVRQQIQAQVPLGTFLSGGTDSSLLAALHSRQSPEQIHTFTLGFDVKGYDETSYANAVSKSLHTQQHQWLLGQDTALQLIQQLYHHYDEPFALNSALPSLFLCKQARPHATVALSGDGGDELFMSYGYYKWYSRYSRIKRMGRMGQKALVWLLQQGNHRQQRAARVLDGPTDDSWWLHVWSQEQYMFNQQEVTLLTGQPYLHHTLLADWQKLQQLPLHGWEKISLFDLKNYLPNNLLYKMDIAGMASGMEVRVPFLDKDLVNYSLNLPLNLKYKQNIHKYLPKRVLTRYIHPDLVYRNKWGFTAPIGEWLNQALKPLVDEWLAPDFIRRQGIFNSEMTTRLLQEFRSGKHPYHHKRVMALVSFQLWYQQYAHEAL